MFPILIQTIQRDSAITFPMLGDLTINPPAYFTVFGKNIYFYGVIIGLGFILGMLYCARRSRDFGLTALCLKWGTAGLCLLLSLLLLHRYGVEHLDWKGLVLCLIGLNLVPLLLAVRPAFRQRPLEERRA